MYVFVLAGFSFKNFKRKHNLSFKCDGMIVTGIIRYELGLVIGSAYSIYAV